MKHIFNILSVLAVCVFPLAWGEQKYIDESELIIEEAPKAIVNSEPKVLILNNQNQQVDQNSKQMSMQPVVHVTGAPISKTHATELRKSRQSAEIHTEQKIVERLENERLRDEQARFNKLFNKQPSVVSVIEQPATILKSTGAAPVSINAIQTSTDVIDDSKEDPVYIGIHGGQIANLNLQVVNLQSFGSFGISFGMKDESGLMVDSTVYYSAHQLAPMNTLFQTNIWNNGFNNMVSNVQQITGAFSVRYTPSSSRVQPYIGASAAYNLWLYQHNNGLNLNWINFNCHLNYQFCAAGFYKTHSVDVGLSTGVDLKLNDKMEIGVNLLLNVLNVYNNHSRMYNNYYINSAFYGINGLFNNTAPISLEETNWVIATVNAKFYF